MAETEMSTKHMAQAEVAHVEIVELIERLVAEGLDWRAVLSGMTSATAWTLIARVGQAEVPTWFARAAAQTMHLAK